MNGLTSPCLGVQVQPQLAGKWAPLASGFQQMWLDFWWFFFQFHYSHRAQSMYPSAMPVVILVVLDPGFSSQDPIHFHMEIAGFTFLGALIHIIAHCVPQVFSRGPEKTSLILLSSWLRWNRLPLAKQNHTGFVFFHVFSMFFFQFTAIFQTWCCYCSIFFHARYISMKFKQRRGCNVIPCNSGSFDQWRNGQWNDILATGWMWELESEDKEQSS